MTTKAASDIASTLWAALGDAYAAMAAHATADAARHGFSLAELAVLDVLHERGPMLLGELQRHVSVSSGGATFLVDRLEGKGLVRRKSCADDRRATFAELTAKGVRVLTRIRPKHVRAIRKAASGLSGRRQRAVTKLLRELAEAANSRPDANSSRRSRTD
ncbi:MAG TPA: MarR family transcriptional regulator [Gemmatimonadaceae bacterium]|nr:MarR family transcriptional regulator [Gemmatimonadaceae bacterium]